MDCGPGCENPGKPIKKSVQSLGSGLVGLPMKGELSAELFAALGISYPGERQCLQDPQGPGKSKHQKTQKKKGVTSAEAPVGIRLGGGVDIVRW